jgi:hypothetical protein
LTLASGLAELAIVVGVEALDGKSGAALYPEQLVSYRYRVVDQNRDFPQTGVDWYVRNEDLVDLVDALAPAIGH